MTQRCQLLVLVPCIGDGPTLHLSVRVLARPPDLSCDCPCRRRASRADPLRMALAVCACNTRISIRITLCAPRRHRCLFRRERPSIQHPVASHMRALHCTFQVGAKTEPQAGRIGSESTLNTGTQVMCRCRIHMPEKVRQVAEMRRAEMKTDKV